MACERRERLARGKDAAALLRDQLREVHRELDEGLNDWLRALEPATPRVGSRVVALYLHAATVEDITVQSLLRRVAPVYKTDWAGEGPGRYSTDHLAPLRAYAQQVFATTDAYLALLGPDALSERVDLSRLAQGQPTMAWVVSKFVVLELAQIYGELLDAARACPRRV